MAAGFGGVCGMCRGYGDGGGGSQRRAVFDASERVVGGSDEESSELDEGEIRESLSRIHLVLTRRDLQQWPNL